MVLHLQPQYSQPDFLAESDVINWQHAKVYAQAMALADGLSSQRNIAKACFEFVRDEIAHSLDAKADGISCSASQVLQNQHGFCYAKSHLLVALLRANNIPAGLCYQRLTISDFPDENETLSYCLHGLVAVQLHDGLSETDINGWYRIDPRGNKQGVNAQFCPPTEQLAFAIKSVGEKDFPQIFAEPLTSVTKVLQHYSKHTDILANLPDASEL